MAIYCSVIWIVPYFKQSPIKTHLGYLLFIAKMLQWRSLCLLSRFSLFRLFVIPCSVTWQAPPGWFWGSQLSFQRLTNEVTANAPLHMFVKCRPPRPAKKRPPQQRLKSPFYSLNQCFSWFQRTTIQFFFFFPLPSFNSETFLSVDFHEPLPNTRCKLKKSHWPISA